MFSLIFITFSASFFLCNYYFMAGMCQRQDLFKVSTGVTLKTQNILTHSLIVDRSLNKHVDQRLIRQI